VQVDLSFLRRWENWWAQGAAGLAVPLGLGPSSGRSPAPPQLQQVMGRTNEGGLIQDSLVDWCDVKPWHDYNTTSTPSIKRSRTSRHKPSTAPVHLLGKPDPDRGCTH